jgi:hypothetical protein
MGGLLKYSRIRRQLSFRKRNRATPADVAGKVTGAPVPEVKFLTRVDERNARPDEGAAAARYASRIAGQACINIQPQAGEPFRRRQIIGAFEESLSIDVLHITY